MKKVLFFLILFFLPSIIFAKEVYIVDVNSYDNGLFTLEKDDQEFSFTLCGIENILENEFILNKIAIAKSIVIETENDDFSKGWMWIDETLLQQDLIKEGLARVSNDNLRYSKSLCLWQNKAKSLGLGIWQNESENYCDNLDLTNAREEISFNEIDDKKEVSSFEGIKNTLDKIDEEIDKYTSSKKISQYYLYVFLLVVIIYFLFKEFKGLR